MIPSFKKRFWTEATVAETGQGFGIELDGRPVRTPAKSLLKVPTADLAAMIAAEWAAQDGAIKPDTMPATKMANAAIDLVSVQFDAVANMLAEYGGSDLICYRAEGPQELVKRQAEAWDPLLDWAATELQAPLLVTTGVLPVAQPEASLRQLSERVFSLDAFALAALHDLVALSGSLVIGLATAANHLQAPNAWQSGRIDEIWQQEQWGVDEDAAATAKIKEREFAFAHRFLSALD
jgi:chaperone required for assembly of F1-ATPase